ncbi:hypothetical protein BKA69DRAFT_35294 [Paraphysoderma sedebokerense]|nr:hypothetical protein BKA69DRAFT_35294 [Paraphysoderma sedebokerense]
MTQKAITFETVRNEFLRWIRINQVIPKPPLCRVFPMIPSKSGDPGPSLLLTDYVIGDAADRLSRQMKARAWHLDTQQRKIFALVQSFGSGKTKTVIELSKEFLVVPIRTLMELDNFKKFKVGRIDKNFARLLKFIENTSSPSEQYRQIKQFHENSVDLLMKLIYVYVDLTLDLYKDFGNSSRSFVEDHRVRRLLAIFIMLSSDVGHPFGAVWKRSILLK